MRNTSEKIVVEKITAHILCSIIFFHENSAANETMWQNVLQPENTLHAHGMLDT